MYQVFMLRQLSRQHIVIWFRRQDWFCRSDGW